MTWGMTAVAGATLVGSVVSSNAAKSAAQTQADANARAQDQLLATGQQASQQFTPYTQLGQSGVNALTQNIPYLTNQFNNQDLNANLAPNYAFQLQQGQGATNAANNATGGMVGGNALKGLQDYTQNYAGTAYQNAFNNYSANQTNIYNRLAGIAGLGYQGAAGTANAQLGTGTNIAQLTQGIGQAQAAGQTGQANALAGGIGNLGNYAFLSSLGKGAPTPISTTGTGEGASLGSSYVPTDSSYLGSDIRLKENIQLLGNLPNGLPLYSFEYKPEFKDDQHCGHGKFIGVMAHEVEKVIPTAVMVRNDGYKVVDYSQIRG